jgi:hypothetical protein
MTAMWKFPAVWYSGQDKRTKEREHTSMMRPTSKGRYCQSNGLTPKSLGTASDISGV